MKIEYDPEVDALYIELVDTEAWDFEDLEPGVTVEMDHDGHVIGIEILGASRRAGIQAAAAFMVDLSEQPGAAGL